MCGRFTLRQVPQVLARQLQLSLPELEPRYNIAPTQKLLAVRQLLSGDGRSSGEREWAWLEWGLIPFWAKDPKIGQRMINCRSETASSKPSYRAAFRQRRCLVPADGYFEWQRTAEGKQPYLFHFPDDTDFAIAGLWERWERDGTAARQSVTLITTEASPAAAEIHDRMPVILESADYQRWLDPEFDEVDELEGMLQPWSGRSLAIDPVSRAVNNPRNDGPQCVAIERG